MSANLLCAAGGLGECRETGEGEAEREREGMVQAAMNRNR